MNNELQIYDEKGTLDDVGLRFNRTEAEALADGWNGRCVISRVYGSV